MSRSTGRFLRRVLPVRGERQRGRPRPGTARPRCGGSAVEVAPGRRVSALVWGSDPPRWCSSTAGARTPTPGTRWHWPSTDRCWPSTCPDTGIRTGPGTAGPSTRGRWPRTWRRSSPAGARRRAGGRHVARRDDRHRPGRPPPGAGAPAGCWWTSPPGSTTRRARTSPPSWPARRSFASFDEILERTIQFNPTRSVSSLRRGVLHNAVQREDGSWTWRHQLGRPPSAPGCTWTRSTSAPCGTTSSASPRRSSWSGASRSPVVDDADEAEFRRRRPSRPGGGGRRTPGTASRGISRWSWPGSSTASSTGP